jgi:benzoyl-CoA reductase/2-hydroxyglutaryl-CoA dehydratase subunit BcrC/BadD/HgdB
MALFTSKEFDDLKSLFEDLSLQKLTQNQLQDGQIQKNSIFKKYIFFNRDGVSLLKK